MLKKECGERILYDTYTKDRSLVINIHNTILNVCLEINTKKRYNIQNESMKTHKQTCKDPSKIPNAIILEIQHSARLKEQPPKLYKSMLRPIIRKKVENK